MNIHLAQRVQQVKPSPTLTVAALAARMKADGMDVISLGTGEPDFDTPQHIKDAAIAAIQSGFTKYTAVDGIAELKQAVKEKFQRENQLTYEPKQILISTGAKQAIYNLCEAFLEAGDEVIIPAPYWVSYPDMVLLSGATPVTIPSSPQNHYKIDINELEQAITPKTKLIFLNSPSNPSGMAYSLDELKLIGAVLARHPHILIASDDIYEHILWSKPFANILNACPELYNRTILFNGVSKAYAMTGWRIGYAAGPEKLIAAMATIQSQSTSNPCSIAQKAAVAALNGGQDEMRMMVQAFQERHQYIANRLYDIPGVNVIPADGTFYSFPCISEIIARKGYVNDLEFAAALLQQQKLALVPGSAFGNEGCIRFSFAASMTQLQKAMDRFAEFCQ